MKNRQSFFVYESSPTSAGCSCFASSWLPSFRWGRTVKVGAVCKTAPLALDCPSNPAALTVCAQRNTIPTSEDAMGTTQSGPVYGIRRGFHGYWRMRSTPAMKNSRRSSTKTSTKKPSRSKAHGAGIRRLRKARASGRSATVSAADNAARQCSGTSIPTVQSGKAGHAATQTAAFGCGSATESCSRKSRSL